MVKCGDAGEGVKCGAKVWESEVWDVGKLRAFKVRAGPC